VPTVLFVGRNPEFMGKHTVLWGFILLPVILGSFIIFAGAYKPVNILPILETEFKDILTTGYVIFSTTFGNIIVFNMLYWNLRSKKKIKKVPYIALLIGGVMGLFFILQGLLLLGPGLSSKTPFPHVLYYSIYHDIRLDPLIILIPIISAGFQAFIFIYGATAGIMDIFRIKEYKSLSVAVGVLISSFVMIIFHNLSEMNYLLLQIFPAVSVLPQIIVPVLLFIISLIKARVYTK
jgi:spore germination protein KB